MTEWVFEESDNDDTVREIVTHCVTLDDYGYYEPVDVIEDVSIRDHDENLVTVTTTFTCTGCQDQTSFSMLEPKSSFTEPGRE